MTRFRSNVGDWGLQYIEEKQDEKRLDDRPVPLIVARTAFEEKIQELLLELCASSCFLHVGWFFKCSAFASLCRLAVKVEQWGPLHDVPFVIYELIQTATVEATGYGHQKDAVSKGQGTHKRSFVSISWKVMEVFHCSTFFCRQAIWPVPSSF